MKVLVIGSGGREHAIIKKLTESKKIAKIYAAPGNGGIANDAINVDIKASDIKAMTEFAVKESINFVVVTPDDPLVLGMVDELTKEGIPCFGPDKAAAQIEGSKVFSKKLMQKYKIPTATYESFDNVEDARKFVGTASYPLWIKTDGLALGKGAIQAKDSTSALKILEQVMVKKAFGESGNSVVIEEHMSGHEVTVLAFCDGKTIRPMLSSMDYKRAKDGDLGLNTGGMGAISPNPYYTDTIAGQCMEKIFLPTICAMESEGCPFKGCIYFGLMLTPKGPRVIEYNCRFGDPETQVLMPMLDTDLFEIMLAVNSGELAGIDIKWKKGAAACVVIASGGYPESYETGHYIFGLDKIKDTKVYHAGTKQKNANQTNTNINQTNINQTNQNGFITSGGRVLSVVATGPNLKAALETAYKEVSLISFDGAYYRNDIGHTVQDS